MTFISFAQNFEDVMLWRALKHVENGFYIDVGAAWPEEHSVTKAFYDRGWSGINVEPNPEHYGALCHARVRDINLNEAVSDKSGVLEIAIFPHTGLSTLDESAAARHQEHGRIAQKHEVNVTTLSALWKEHVRSGQDVHFLKVDVEGFEKEALIGNDWCSYRPWIVVVEATRPMSQEESYASWEPILLNAHYHFAYADGLNRFYVAKEHEELLLSFKYPPNVFDGFVSSGQIDAENRADSAETRATSAENRAVEIERECMSGAEAELMAVLNSRSWKITAPLRWLVAGVKKSKPRVKKVIRNFVGEVVYMGMRIFPPHSRVRRATVLILSRFPVLKEKLRALALQGHSSVTLSRKGIAEYESLSPTAKRYYEVLDRQRKSMDDGRR